MAVDAVDQDRDYGGGGGGIRGERGGVKFRRGRTHVERIGV